MDMQGGGRCLVRDMVALREGSWELWVGLGYRLVDRLEDGPNWLQPVAQHHETQYKFENGDNLATTYIAL